MIVRSLHRDDDIAGMYGRNLVAEVGKMVARIHEGIPALRSQVVAEGLGVLDVAIESALVEEDLLWKQLI